MGMLHITCLRLNTSPRAFGPQAGIQSQASNMQHRPKKSRYCVIIMTLKIFLMLN